MSAIKVGVDDGHYGIKVVTEKGCIMFRSRGKTGRHLINTMGTSGDDGGLYQTDEDTDITVHEHLTDSADTRFPDYPKSALNRVFVHHGLLKAGLGGKDVKIVTGLPFASFYSANGERNDTLINAKIKSLTKPVRARDKELANIVANTVTTEAVAAYYDQLVDMEGNDTPFSETLLGTTTGVIDIGGKTTDVAVVLPSGNSGLTLDTTRSGTDASGVLILNKGVESRLIQMFELDYVNPFMVEKAIHEGKFEFLGKTHDVKELVDAEKESMMKMIEQGVRSKIGSGRELGRLIIVGGGSIILKEQLQRVYKNAIFPDSPAFANARGMYKMALDM